MGNEQTNEDNVLHLENSEFDLHLRIDHFQDEGEEIRFIKSVEKMVRRSSEYALWRDYITDILGQTTCEITNEDASDCSIEIHHHPVNLYTIVKTVVDDYIRKKVEFSTFDIATKVIELHFQNKVGYVVMISNMHEKFHRGKLMIPIEYVRGDYKYIPTHFALAEDDYTKYLEYCNIHKEEVAEQWGKGNYPGIENASDQTAKIDSTISTIDDDKQVKELISKATSNLEPDIKDMITASDLSIEL